MPGVRTTRTTPVPSPADAGGDRRALGPEAHGVLPGPAAPAPAARARRPGGGRRGHRRRRLAPEGTAVGQRRGRLTPGLAPRGVGLQVGRLDPRRAQGQVPVAVGHGSRAAPARPWCGGPAPCPAAGGPRPGSRPRPSRPRRRARPPARRPGRGRRRSRRAPSATSGPTRWGAPPSSAARRAAASRSRSPAARPAPDDATARGLEDGAPAGAPAEVGGQGPVDRRLVGQADALAPGAPRGARRCPGVQNPHWLAPVAQKASAQASRSAGSRPVQGGHRPTGDPAGRGHAGHAGCAVDQHRAAAALALGAAAVLGRRAARAGRAATSSSDAPSSATSTWAPSTSNCRRGASGVSRALRCRSSPCGPVRPPIGPPLTDRG